MCVSVELIATAAGAGGTWFDNEILYAIKIRE